LDGWIWICGYLGVYFLDIRVGGYCWIELDMVGLAYCGLIEILGIWIFPMMDNDWLIGDGG